MDIWGLTVNISELFCLSSYFHCNIAAAEGGNSCCKLNSANSLFYSVIPLVILALFCFRLVCWHITFRDKFFEKVAYGRA